VYLSFAYKYIDRDREENRDRYEDREIKSDEKSDKAFFR
jgi:hypothetical protein